MSQCVICGEYVPEGYGQTCAMCQYRFGQRQDLSPLENENRQLRMILEMERKERGKMARKLEKAEHDRDRYAKRIKFMDARHTVLSRTLRAALKEGQILEAALKACEKALERSIHHAET